MQGAREVPTEHHERRSTKPNAVAHAGLQEPGPFAVVSDDRGLRRISRETWELKREPAPGSLEREQGGGGGGFVRFFGGILDRDGILKGPCRVAYVAEDFPLSAPANRQRDTGGCDGVGKKL